MAIDLIHEQSVSIAFARNRLIPELNGKAISPATAYRWIDKGVLAGDGVRVRLEAVKVGRNLVTTEESVQRLLDELTRRSAVTPTSDSRLSSEVTEDLRSNGLLPPESVPTAAPVIGDFGVVAAATDAIGI